MGSDAKTPNPASSAEISRIICVLRIFAAAAHALPMYMILAFSAIFATGLQIGKQTAAAADIVAIARGAGNSTGCGTSRISIS
jgi:predicted nuclease with TOPRIM domain